MRLLLLGTGTCLDPLVGATPRLPPLFALDASAPGEPPLWILFDCSEGARWRLPAAGVASSLVRHIALSHPHADHAALPQFLQGRACEGVFRKNAPPLSLHLPRASADALPDLWRWHQPEDGGKPSSRFRLDVTPCDHGSRIDLAPGVTLEAFSVFHGSGGSPALAFRLEARGLVFAYSGDTGLCDGIFEAARGADLFLCEASSAVGVDMARTYGHLNPRQAADVARQAGARRLVLTHYTGLEPDTLLLEDAARSGFSGEIRVGHDGEELGISSPGRGPGEAGGGRP